MTPADTPANMPDDIPVAFYADPVDEDGNVIATCTLTITKCTWAPDMRAVKVPMSELVLEDEG